MRRIIVLFCLVSISLHSISQQCPPEWVKYTLGGYLYVIESDYNTKNLSETAFKDYLLSVARTNLAKQIEVQVQENALMQKQAINGKTNIEYNAATLFKTDVNLKLVGTETLYNAVTSEGWAVAYIDKQAAIGFYSGEVYSGLAKAESAITIADNYVANGFKTQAKETLQKALADLPKLDDNLFWLHLLGQNQSLTTSQESRRNNVEQQLKQNIAELEHSNSIYLVCTADIFGTPYPTLQNTLKGLLATNGCNFVDNPDAADWVIQVEATSREYNTTNYGGYMAYFVYVDARVVIDKVITGQRIYEDEISVKGSHTLSYKDAARAGYKDIDKEISKLLKTYIQ